MSDRAQRIEVFNDTQDWIKNDPALSASIPVAKKNTTVFYEDDYPAFNSSKTRDTVITVSGDRSYQAAMKLHRENPDAKIAVMNFANAFHAGGGVTTGASAQEECLCRTSTLYPLLYRRTLRDSFYKHHHDLNSPKATDSLVYTEGVIICKTDEDLPKRMPQDDWVTVDVITIAAPDLRDKSNVHEEHFKGYARERCRQLLVEVSKKEVSWHRGWMYRYKTDNDYNREVGMDYYPNLGIFRMPLYFGSTQSSSRSMYKMLGEVGYRTNRKFYYCNSFHFQFMGTGKNVSESYYSCESFDIERYIQFWIDNSDCIWQMDKAKRAELLKNMLRGEIISKVEYDRWLSIAECCNFVLPNVYPYGISSSV